MNSESSTPLVDRNRPCLRCSYNLRGLPTDGPCPECGTPVQDSLRGSLLQFSSLEYLGTLVNGLSLLTCGLILLVVGIIGGLTALALRGSLDGGMGLLCLVFLAGLLIFIGHWLYTAPDPALVEGELRRSARRIARGTLVAIALLFGLMMLLGFNLFGVRNQAAVKVFVLAFVSCLLGVFVLFIATMRYTRSLIARIPDPTLEWRAKVDTWTVPAVCILGVILGGVIGIVMVLALLFQVRRHLKSILTTGMPFVRADSS